MADDSRPTGGDDSGASSGDAVECGLLDEIELDEIELDEQIVAAIEREEADAARRLAAIDAGRRKGGVAGAAMAGAMLAISEIYEGPKRDEIVAVSESPDEPDDIDTDGITVDLDGRQFWAPPPNDGE
ncbi:MAG: hypothetical protein AAFP84_09010 [Actinomycetota bacterium]